MGWHSLDQFTSLEIAKASAFSDAIRRYLQYLNSDSGSFNLLNQRHTGWCEAALNTLFQKCDTREICTRWSICADQIITSAWCEAGLDKYPVALFAMGKLGSRELNLSSDIDLFIISDDGVQIPSGLIRRFDSIASQQSEYGFLFRTDYDLRPGGPSSPLVCNLSQMINHYWSFGENWERLALVRLRPVVGDPEVINQACEATNKFTYRRYLDYSLFEAFSSLRKKIHQHQLQKNLDDLDIKLCRGGIREIELFTHSLATIHGGRSKSLQNPSTQAILEELEALEILNRDESQLLIHCYWSLRHFENLMQIRGDTQTHRWQPVKNSKFFNHAQDELFNTIKKQVCEFIDAKLSPGIINRENEEKLAESSLNSKPNGHETAQTIAEIRQTILSTQNGRNQFDAVFSKFIHEIKEDHLIEPACEQFARFFKAVKAPTSTVSMLVQHPELLSDLAVVFSQMPYLSSILCSRPELLDELVLRHQELKLNDVDELVNQLFDRKLVNEILSGIDFLKTGKLSQLLQNLTHNADKIVKTLLEFLENQFNPSFQTDILALGKWGSSELGFRSDLDFIILVDELDGKDQFRFAQKLIHLITSPVKGGRLFEVDLSLRPSGRSGPLLVTKSHFLKFMKTSAAAWQLQSYLRARSITGSQIVQSLTYRTLTSEDWREIKAIREKLLVKSTTDGSWSLKLEAGGLVDIELCMQGLVINAGLAPKICGSVQNLTDGLISSNSSQAADLQKLLEAYLFLRKVEQLANLFLPMQQSRLHRSHIVFNKISACLKMPTEELAQRLDSLLLENALIVKDLDPCYRQ